MTTLDLDALERAAGNRVQGMVRDFDRWAKMDPKAVAAGSEAQVIYALEDAKTDIAALAQFVRALQERVEGAEKALAFYRDGFQFHPKRGPTGIDHSEWHPTQSLLDDCGNVAVAYFAARTKAGEPLAEQGGEDASR